MMKAGDHFVVTRGFYACKDSTLIVKGARGVCLKQHELAPRQCLVRIGDDDFTYFEDWIRDSFVRVLSPLEVLAECAE